MVTRLHWHSVTVVNPTRFLPKGGEVHMADQNYYPALSHAAFSGMHGANDDIAPEKAGPRDETIDSLLWALRVAPNMRSSHVEAAKNFIVGQFAKQRYCDGEVAATEWVEDARRNLAEVLAGTPRESMTPRRHQEVLFSR